MGMLAIIVVFTTVIAIHEFGHYIIAKWCGVHVTDFAIGMGPKLFGWTDKSGTEWKVCALPFGGYVKMLGNDPRHPVPEELEHKSYTHKTPLQRIAILFAGPLINFISGAIFFIGLIFYFNVATHYDVRVTEVPAESIMQEAGLQEGDILKEVNGIAVVDFTSLSKALNAAKDEGQSITVERKGETVNLTSPHYGFGNTSVEFTNKRNIYPSVTRAISVGVSASLSMLEQQALGVYKLVTGQVKLDTLSSVIGIGDTVNMTVNDAADQVERKNTQELKSVQERGGIQLNAEPPQDSTIDAAFQQTWFMIIALSFGIGMINLVPIPPLDGGQIIVNTYQLIARRPMPDWVFKGYMLAGLGLVLFVFLYASYNDVLRIVERLG